MAGTSLRLSSAYHPQTDGQTERLNQCLETYLRCMVQSCPTKWTQWIPLAEFWYNSTFHSALGLTPFQALYGHKPRHFGITVDDTCTVSDLDQWLKERQSMLDHIQQNLQRAQDRMKRQADKDHSERVSLTRRANHKLSFRFFGPFKILEKLGPVAYKLELPPSSTIHPVFHVSQLKFSPSAQQVSTTLPSNL